MTKFIILLFVLISSLFSQGDRLPGSSQNRYTEYERIIPDDLKIKTSEFFNLLLDSNVTAAYNKLLKNSNLLEKKDKLNALLVQTHRAFDIYGKLKGYELVNSEIISNSFIRTRYLGKHAKYPMRWIFTFYLSPEAGWVLTNIKFDDLSETFFKDE